jgi:hypothetical protein
MCDCQCVCVFFLKKAAGDLPAAKVSVVTVRAVIRGPVLTRSMANEEQLRVAFAFFDDDNNGYIVRSELQAALEQMGQQRSEEEIDDMLSTYDLNHDGRLSFPEFVKMMQAMQPPEDAGLPLATVVRFPNYLCPY